MIPEKKRYAMKQKKIFAGIASMLAFSCLAADLPALIGHYDLNEGSGSVVHNRQGRAGHGKFRGPVAWAPTLQGSGILLDGATNSVFCGPMPEMDETKGMTLLVWFKSTHPMGLRIIASAENPATGEGWRFGVDSNKLVSVLPRDTAGDDWSDGLWHLGALVILGNEAREYVDGKITRSMKLPKPVKLNAGATLAIGSLSGKDLGGFHGVIDDVKIYNAVLSAAEIGNEFKRLIKTPQNNPELEFRRNMIVKMLAPARRQADRLPGKLKQNYEKISSCLSAVPLAVRGTELRKSMRTLETLSAEAKVFRNELDKERLRRINRSADARQPLVWGATALDNIFNDQLLPDGDVSGKIRLWTSDGLGTGYLSACLSEFIAKYPDVKIDIVCSLDSPNSISTTDMAIVYDEPEFDDGEIVSRYELKFGLFASMDYLSKFGYPKDIKDLQENHRICDRENFAGVWPQWKKIIEGAKSVVATTNSSAMMLRMTRDGIGIGLHPVAIGKRESELIHLSQLGLKISHPFWIVSHKDGLEISEIKALIEHIREVTLQL